MTTTTFGRLGPQHKGVRVRIDDRFDKAEGILEDVCHYLDHGTTSIRFAGETRGIFRNHDWAIEILDIPEPAPDALVNIAEAYDDGHLALEASNNGWRKQPTQKVAAAVIDSSFTSICQALADVVQTMLDNAPAGNHEEDDYAAGQQATLVELRDWLREVMPTATEPPAGD